MGYSTVFKVKAIKFFDKHGEAATKDAFGIGRSSLFLWKKKLRESFDNSYTITNRSTRRVRLNQRVWDYRITDFIRQLRLERPRLGKEKMSVLLFDQCQNWQIKCPSISTVGRLIGDLKKCRKLPEYRKTVGFRGDLDKLVEIKMKTKPKTRRQGLAAKEAGDIVQIDTVITFVQGVKRYTVTAVDLVSRFCFAYTYTNLSSSVGKDFFLKLEQVCPFTIKHVQTDNGLEFLGQFDQYLQAKGVPHFFNYPKHPKQNAYVERFNRSLQEEFLNWHLHDLKLDVPYFNQKLMEWLVWCNTERPHFGLDLMSPMQYLLGNLMIESKMWWTDTIT
jgi:putative transposase